MLAEFEKTIKTSQVIDQETQNAANHKRNKPQAKHTPPTANDAGNRQNSKRTPRTTLQPPAIHRNRNKRENRENPPPEGKITRSRFCLDMQDRQQKQQPLSPQKL